MLSSTSILLFVVFAVPAVSVSAITEEAIRDYYSVRESASEENDKDRGIITFYDCLDAVADFFPGKVTEADLKFGTDKFYYIQDLYQAAQGRKDWNLNAKQFVTFIGEVEMLINSNFQLVAAAE